MKFLILGSQVAALTLAVLSSGCSVKGGAGDSGQPSTPKSTWADKRETITGPTVEGLWSSDCVTGFASSSDSRSQKFAVQFSGSNVKRSEVEYSDSRCQSTAKTTVSTGVFRFVQLQASGSYVVEYNFDLGSGWHSFPEELLWRKTDAVYLSNYLTGTAIPIEYAVKLNRVTAIQE